MLRSILLALSFALPLTAELSKQEIIDIATESYIYGYPLVTMDLTRQVMTNVAEPAGLKSPMGQFMNAKVYPDASFIDVTAPNADTLYSTAWIDLTSEPYILHVPEESGRYYLMPMLSGWTDVFASPGTRTTGTSAQDFAITGPLWQGTLPQGIKEIKSPTNMVWILGRTYCSGTSADYDAVHKIQDEYTLVPLSAYGKPYTAPKGVIDPNIDMQTPVRTQVNQMAAAKFFTTMLNLMKNNPPSAADAPMVEKMAKIGLIPGKALDPKMFEYLEMAPKLAIEKIMAIQHTSQDLVNGWHFTTKTGQYGTDYLERAYVAAIGLGANLPQDAVYPYATVDDKGAPLQGTKQYKIHFEKGQIPPVKGFWSLTMYNDQYFFVANPLNRYTLSPRNALQYNADGSLDLYVQHDSPGPDKESNWLPSPAGPFVLMLRLYWPEESVISGLWKPPMVAPR